MIHVDPQYLDGIRSVQEMFITTKAGQLLLAGLMDSGHFALPPKNETERIEHVFAHRILTSAGIEMVPKQAELVSLASPDENLIDREVGPQGEDEHE